MVPRLFKFSQIWVRFFTKTDRSIELLSQPVFRCSFSKALLQSYETLIKQVHSFTIKIKTLRKRALCYSDNHSEDLCPSFQPMGQNLWGTWAGTIDQGGGGKGQGLFFGKKWFYICRFKWLGCVHFWRMIHTVWERFVQWREWDSNHLPRWSKSVTQPIELTSQKAGKGRLLLS